MKREKKSQRTAGELRQATDEAISFMRSMLRLVERRGIREVDYTFAHEMFAMAAKIIDPGHDGDAPLDPGRGAYEFLEGVERVPLTAFKAIFELVERELRKDLAHMVERMSAQRPASPPVVSKQGEVRP
jgi:hypothetical protein